MGTPATASCDGYKEKEILCKMICTCEFLYKGNPGAGVKRQACVDAQLYVYNKLNPNSNMFPEVPYYVNPVTNTAFPLLSNASQKLSIGGQIYNARLAATNFANASSLFQASPINPLQKQTDLGNYKDIVSDIKSAGGGLRKPDVTVLNNPQGDFMSDNIKNIYEIKFPPDKWRAGQQEAYNIIAGDPSKVEQLGPKECKCGDQDKETEPSGAKAPAPAVLPEPGLEEDWGPPILGGIVGAAALTYVGAEALGSLIVEGAEYTYGAAAGLAARLFGGGQVPASVPQ